MQTKGQAPGGRPLTYHCTRPETRLPCHASGSPSGRGGMSYRRNRFRIRGAANLPPASIATTVERRGTSPSCLPDVANALPQTKNDRSSQSNAYRSSARMPLDWLSSCARLPRGLDTAETSQCAFGIRFTREFVATMIQYDRFNWRSTVFSFRGTALKRASARILMLTLFACLVQAAYQGGEHYGWIQQFVGLDPTGHAVLGSLLGFLIVFRMNASNSRFWEGRSHWGQLINSSRNLVRAGVEYTDTGMELANLVTGYVICVRRSLQGNADTEEADVFLPESLCHEVSHFGNPPTGVAAAISAWIGRNHRNGQLSSQMVRHLEVELSRMVDSQGGCEKILKTPLPFVYAVMVKQLILVYLATLPISVCDRIGWWTPFLVGIVSLGLFGMEEASVEIEDPFGTDDNCLDMDNYTLTIARDTGQLAARKAQIAAGSVSSEFEAVILK
ncbi:MAG: bestrophin family protein [Planctomycetales bacterium]